MTLAMLVLFANSQEVSRILKDMWATVWTEYYIVLLSSCSQLWKIITPLSLKLNTWSIWVVAKMAFKIGYVLLIVIVLYFVHNVALMEMFVK